MKIRYHLLAAFAVFCAALSAQEKAAPELPPYRQDLRAVRSRVSAKIDAGAKSKEAFAPEEAELKALFAKYHDQPDAAAWVLYDRVFFTLNILKDEALAKQLLNQVIADYPGTEQAEKAKGMLHALSPEGKAERAAAIAAEQAKREALIGHIAPEMDLTWSSLKGVKKLEDLRGKVVVLDFWATWCGPCIASFPKVRAEVAHFANSPVVFLGVTSLQGKVHGLEAKPIDVKDQPEKEYALTADFAKKHEMTWPIAFSSQNVFNPDYVVKGIPNVVIIAPDGTVRHVGLNPHTPGVDIQGKITAILREFQLPVPNAV